MDSLSSSNYLFSSAHVLFRRCVQCPTDTPGCPTCAADEDCSLISQSCDACAFTQCIKSPLKSTADTSKSSSPAGPIAGGIIGGIILVGALVFLVYWFYMRPRRQNWTAQLNDLKEIPTPDNRSFIEERSKRASTHTVASVKSNGTRASIPIAYIPGVTSHGENGSPEMIPPVPPIPAAGGSPGNALSPRTQTGGEMFFRPESYTDVDLDKQSIAGRSRRSSIQSEYFNDSHQMPTQAAMAVKATPISLHSKGSNSRLTSPNRSPNATPPLSHQNSIAGRMQGQGPITGQSGQARQIVITRSQSNLRGGPGGMNTIAELDDTSTAAPTPRLLASELDDTSVGSRTPKLGWGLDRSGTASPRSMLSDDAEGLMQEGRWRKPSVHGNSTMRSPDFNNPPVSAAGQSTFSKSSPVSAIGWDPQASIRSTIRDAANQGYSSQGYNGQNPYHNNNNNNKTQNSSGAAGGSAARYGNQPDSPFGDQHATQ